MLFPDSVYGFHGSAERRFGPLLTSFFADRPSLGSTELCRIMSARGSDKGNGWHSYTPFYSRLLSPMRETAMRVFEMGIGSTRPDIPFTRSDGLPGGSLRGWRDWFTKARVFGADIDRHCQFTEDRIRTYYADQGDPDSLRAMWAEIAVGEGGEPDRVKFDLIVDDGCHTYEFNHVMLMNSLHMLRPGGLYVIEDVWHHPANIARWQESLPKLGRPAMIIRLPFYGLTTNVTDNCLIIIEA